jgi:serine/threonine protein kinase
MKYETEELIGPVIVDADIPAAAEHEVDAETIARRSIPIPVDLQVQSEIARGAFGRIHQVSDLKLMRTAALKYLCAEQAAKPIQREAFIAEAQITGQLQHPNIVPVHELGISDNGTPYFTMKLIYGENLEEWAQSNSHALGSSARLSEGLEIFMKVCDALAYAHHRGVIHRDLKPANIMVGDFGQVYLMDWGIARLKRAGELESCPRYMTQKGVTGTPHYMAPEQANGDPAATDERTDIFSLGAILYELLAGVGPYGNDRDPYVILARAQNAEVTPIEDALLSQPFVSSRLCRIVDKALAAAKEDRYQTVKELKEALSNFVRGGLHLPRRIFMGGELVINEGDIGDSAFLILEGSCRAFRIIDGEKVVLSKMERGDFFGELALVLDEPRSASVEALSRMTVLVLDRATIEDGFAVDGWSGALIRALAQRFRQLEKKA